MAVQLAQVVGDPGGSGWRAGALRRYELTLDQAAAVAEFDPDREAITLLTAAAGKDPEQILHGLQQLRDERADSEALAARRTETEAPQCSRFRVFMR